MEYPEERLSQLGISLPQPPKSIANYIPIQTLGDILYASGQTPVINGELLYRGTVGLDISIEEGYEAAKISTINILAWIEKSLGSINRIKKIVKVNGYVRSVHGFTDQPKVINGASDLLVMIFGDAGKHARTAIGVNELPGGSPVEIELIAEIWKM